VTLPEWWPAWRGETVVIVASGPSATEIPLAEARGRARFMAINESWRLAPWSDILFGCDLKWWQHVKGCPDFQGLKLSTEDKAARPEWGVHPVGLRRADDRMEFEKLGTVGWGGNSGFHCYNLAVQFGCEKIIFVGYDMTIRHGFHWHGKHPQGLNNPTSGNTERWRRAIDAPAARVAALGIRVINCSPVSTLRNYPKMTFAEALAA
jgi:hypothetical protein